MQENDTGLTRRAREQKERKELILDVAERLFAGKGLKETSMTEIAKEAEFGVGTLYKYFEDKNTLVQTLVRDRMNKHYAVLEAGLLTEGLPEHIIEKTVAAYLSSVKANKLFFKFFMTNFHPGLTESGGPIDVSFLCEKQERIITLMNSVFKRGIDAGLFAPIDPESLTGALLGMMLAFHFRGESQLRGEWNADEFKQKILTIFFQPVLLVKT